MTPVQKRDARDRNDARNIEHAIRILQELVTGAKNRGLDVKVRIDSTYLDNFGYLGISRHFKAEARIIQVVTFPVMKPLVSDIKGVVDLPEIGENHGN